MVMGILNVTPDSFFDGGKHDAAADLQAQVMKLKNEGADIVDVGGYSSRPGAAEVTEEEEIQRVLKGIAAIKKNWQEAIISVDTFRASVARKGVEAGAHMINDISAGQLDDQMFLTVADLQVPYIMMHMRGTPGTMQSMTDYENLTLEMVHYFESRLKKLRDLGVNDVLIDPGFGFAKTLEQNYQLLNEMDKLALLQLPILVGVSRKSMIYKLLGGSPAEALNGTTVLNTLALTKGANILRVHDVKEAKECVELFAKMLQP
ncbi:dihydropteroate synthase [Persicobacter diffluens]|uniref:Dihydropteroate synthase n=2 Tax=Persicobacter diffluens TaxID=981 RepID=A0AAN4VY39_9BACT|nr:dihydropteroate synthase [Persicobacter diffluens]